MTTRRVTMAWMAVLSSVLVLSLPAFAQDVDEPDADAGTTETIAAPPAAPPVAPPVEPPAEQDDLELQRAQIELEKVKAEAEKAKWEAEKAKAEAETAKAGNSTRDIQKNNNFTINPLGLVFGGLGVTYTRGLADLISLGFTFVYVTPLWIPAHTVGGMFEFYFWPRHPNNGFFIGPFCQISRTFPTDEGYLGVTAVTPGLMLGWRWIWQNGFNLGLGGGGGWAFAVGGEGCPSGKICTLLGSGPAPRLQLDLGYAF